VFAKKGDALILHYGPKERSKLLLIDGGPRGVYRKWLRPRLQELREDFQLDDDESLPFRLVMVSHIDDDHIAGIIDLFDELQEAKRRRRPAPFKVHTLWHNSFDDLLDNKKLEVVSRMASTAASNDPQGLPIPPQMRAETKAVVASTAQGRTLRNAAKVLRVKTNAPFKGLIMAPAAKRVSLGHRLRFTVLGPSRSRVLNFQKKWDKDLKKILKKEKESAKATAFEDDSPFNLASICVLAEMRRKKILLTGDARGDYVMEGLKKARLLGKTKPLHVDILKVPHHGSDRNVEDRFFKKITADHYVISGDGEHGNPEQETLMMIQRARGCRQQYTIHFTFTEDAHLHEKNKKRKSALKKVAAWVRQKPGNCTVRFRAKGKNVRSLHVDLLHPL